jgi:hypothetical protein
MGCCYKKNLLLENLNDFMQDFYFRLIRKDFLIAQIKEFNSKTGKNYFEFWSITKLLGIHSELQLQVDYWESAYVQHFETSINGILFIFLLLCKAEAWEKLEYIKYYLNFHVNHAKEADANLIMNLYEFKKILFVYFSCVSVIPLNTFLKIKRSTMSSQFLEQFEKQLKEKFTDDNVQSFTSYILKDYVKKNFYVNAGKFLNEKIELLTNDKLIRETIFNFTTFKSNSWNVRGSKESNSQAVINKLNNNQNPGEEANINTEMKPLKSKGNTNSNSNKQKSSKTKITCLGSEREFLNKNKRETIVFKEKKKNK